MQLAVFSKCCPGSYRHLQHRSLRIYEWLILLNAGQGRQRDLRGESALPSGKGRIRWITALCNSSSDMTLRLFSSARYQLRTRQCWLLQLRKTKPYAPQTGLASESHRWLALVQTSQAASPLLAADPHGTLALGHSQSHLIFRPCAWRSPARKCLCKQPQCRSSNTTSALHTCNEILLIISNENTTDVKHSTADVTSGIPSLGQIEDGC